MKYSLIVALALFTSGTVGAKNLQCTIHPPKGSSDSALTKLATITPEIALAKAKAVFPRKNVTVKSFELESESGCLVYSFDVVVPGKAGIDEVLLDAGNGAVLSHSHESPKQEAAEAAEDKH